jgi:hypothetical protein
MSTTWRTRRAIAFAWLWRSQSTSPLFDGEQADKILARHGDLIKNELSRIEGLKDITVEPITATLEEK